MTWVPIAVGVGAVLGALGRYYASLFWARRCGHEFPYGTLFVNLLGAFAIGFLSIALSASEISTTVQKLMIVGFLGSFTTFSSYILDSANLFQRQALTRGFFYWLGSPVLGFICVELGLLCGKALLGR